MKFMTFNNSCFFAALANLLEEYNIDVSDRELLLQGKINLVFRFNEEESYYYSGYQIQQEKWINNCLKNYDMQFVERIYNDHDLLQNKQNLITFLKSYNQKCVVALKVLNSIDRWHATIFQGFEGNNFRFLNMKRSNSNEPTYFIFNEKELLMKLADNVRCGWIEKKSSDFKLNIEDEKTKSSDALNKYKKDIIMFCSNESSEYERSIKMESLFRALFISYYSVVEIMDDKELLTELKIVRDDYIKTFQLKGDIILGDYINLLSVSNIIDKIIYNIENY